MFLEMSTNRKSLYRASNVHFAVILVYVEESKERMHAFQCT